MTAEPIAEVVADIRAGRIQHPVNDDRLNAALLKRAQLPQPVVDCTAIFAAQMAREEIALYEDHPQITPPWTDSLLCFVNTFGNVIALQVHRRDWDGSAPTREDWFTENDVDWSTVRWIAETAVWVGGRSGDGKYLPTSGPCHMFRHAISASGEPLDINWLALLGPRGRQAERRQLGDPNQATWDASMITLGAALNFLNCTNIEIAEPHRPRPIRRRLARTGVTVQAIVVRPPGRRRQPSGTARPMDELDTPLTSVRGSFGRYGPEFGAGLLFGKYSGKFWRPAHARGQGDAEPRDYVLKPGSAA